MSAELSTVDESEENAPSSLALFSDATNGGKADIEEATRGALGQYYPSTRGFRTDGLDVKSYRKHMVMVVLFSSATYLT